MYLRERYPVPPEYHKVAEVGRGGMSRVFACECKAQRRRVAVKVSSPELSAFARQVCFREGWLTSRLQVDKVVRVDSYGKLGNQVWMAMELIEGRSLHERLARGVFTVQQRLRVLDGVARTLGVLHDRGIVHRDVRAQNVMVVGHDDIRLIDFGLAKREGARTLDGQIVGALDCAPPEMLLGGPNDRRVDLFQLGLLAFTLFCREPPWPPSDDPVTTVKQICTLLPRGFIDTLTPLARQALPAMEAIAPTVMGLVAYDPARRPDNTRALTDRIASIFASPEMLPPVWVDPIDVDPWRPSLAALCGA